MLEDGLCDDFEFFIEQIIECKSILADIIQNTQEIVSYDENTISKSNKNRFERNLFYLDNIDKNLTKIKHDLKKIRFFCNAEISYKEIKDESLCPKKVIIFPLNKVDDIYVDLNNPLKNYFKKDDNKN